MRCLIVDDEVVCRKKVRLLLEEVAECEDAVDGSEAIAKFTGGLLTGKPFDVIVLDIIMPGIDGHETAREIRRIEREIVGKPSVKIVMLTVLNSVNDAMRSLYDAQAVGYIVKPVSEDKFLETFRNVGII